MNFSTQKILNYFIEIQNDNLSTAEESVHKMKKSLRVDMKRVNELKRKANESNGNNNEIINCYVEAKRILGDLSKQIYEMEVSELDGIISTIGNVLAIVATIGGSIGVNKLEAWSNNGKGSFSAKFMGAIGGGFVGAALTKGMRNRKNMKAIILTKIESEIVGIEECIKVLKEPKKYNVDKTDFNALRESYKKYYETELNKVLNTLVDELNTKVFPKLKEIGLPFKFEMFSKTSIHWLGDEHVPSDYSKESELEDVQEYYEKCIKDFWRRYKVQFKKLHVDELVVDNDSWLNSYILCG